MHKKIEEFSLNAWPALQTFLYDGWLLRFADGYTKRSNSISPIYHNHEQSLQEIEEKIRGCESLYSQVGLNTVFKITPFVIPEHLDSILEQQSYEVLDLTSVRILDLSEMEEPETNNVTIHTEISNTWLEVVSSLNNLTKAHTEITRKLLSSSYLKKGFFTLYEDSIPVACGVGVIEQDYVGLYDIVTDHKYRNRGYGRELVLHILKWAKANGARHSYLQVLHSNEPANRLYERLGYREIYTYWYRRKKRVGLVIKN